MEKCKLNAIYFIHMYCMKTNGLLFYVSITLEEIVVLLAISRISMVVIFVVNIKSCNVRV